MPVAANTRKTKRSPFQRYRQYITRLQKLTNESAGRADWEDQAHAALNGQATVELRRSAPRKVRRKYGAYFTGTVLAGRLLSKCRSLEGRPIFYDPSCGVGDLLLAAAKKLPLAKTFRGTLALWGRQLTGTDLHAEFIDGAKTRLILLARHRHGLKRAKIGKLSKFFPNIKVGNGLNNKTLFQQASTLLMNPPFGLVVAPKDYRWTRGRVSEAAIFLFESLQRVQPGTEILAILPEVLRSGSFSESWRNEINKLAEVHIVETYGIFDESADIDVFLVRLTRRTGDEPQHVRRWPSPRRRTATVVGEHFNVHVGRVVPHRDKQIGRKYAYIHPRNVPTWIVLRKINETRRHWARVYSPPFVVIRRTSRPGHPYRATATVIAGKRSVAVENHLIVCEPKDKTLRSCRELMRQLKSDAINDFLNKRIRCRHLTVGVVQAIPFQPKTRSAA